MTTLIHKNWKFLVLTIIAIFIVSSASGAVFAQDKYPKPDFSEMEEYFEIVDSEYNFVGLGAFIVTAKPEKKGGAEMVDNHLARC